MFHKSFLLFILVSLSDVSFAQKKHVSPFPDGVKRVLFIGNSITYAGEFVTDVEAYLTTRYPGMDVEFINVGLPSETVSGLSEPGHADGKFPRPDLHERLDRVLRQTKPDWVIACYGMNDGIYLPIDEKRFQKYKDGIRWLHKTVLRSGVKKIIHLTPPVFDERKGGHPGYAHVLDIYSEWLLKQRTASHWDVADIHGAMKMYQDERIKKDPSFALAADGVHPGETGHWVMAKAILQYLGETDVSKWESVKDALSPVPNGEHILKLIGERQEIMKDACLTRTGHRRPGMKEGMPLEEAQMRAREIGLQVEGLMK